MLQGQQEGEAAKQGETERRHAQEMHGVHADVGVKAKLQGSGTRAIQAVWPRLDLSDQVPPGCSPRQRGLEAQA